MAGKKELDEALEGRSAHHEMMSIRQCVSEYPTQPQNVNLMTIAWLKENYPDYTVGYSDHTIGISMPVAACAMGARIIEKHVTLDRRMKGTDQKGSLGIDGCQRLVRDIRQLEMSMGEKSIKIEKSVEVAREKLERSCAAKINLQVGHVIREDDLELRSPGDGVKWSERQKLIGATVTKPIASTEIIYDNCVKK